MKNLFLLVISLMAASTAQAQVSASIGYTHKPIHDDTQSASYNGFNIGLDYGYNIVGDLFVSTGLGMDMIFDQAELNDTTYYGKCIDFSIPVDFSYGFSLGSNMKLNIYAGPTFELGVLNKTSNDYGFSLDYYNDKVQDEDFDYTLKRFNLFIGGGVSLDIKDRYRIKVGYKKGLVDLDKTGEYPYKEDRFTASIGYIF